MKNLKNALAITTILLGLGGSVVLAQQPAHDHSPAVADTPSTKGFKEVNMKMMKAMEMTYTGNSDVDFVRSMIPHHQGAIDMAKVQLANGKDPQLLEMAKQIIADQEKEIAVMQAWLKKNAK
jgi:uncharacterized protein (DUF305 family)